MSSTGLPAYNDLLWPALKALRWLGHSAKLEEIDERVIAQEQFSEDQMAVLHKDGPRSEIEYRLAWARTYLKGMGIFDTRRRGLRRADRTTPDAPNPADSLPRDKAPPTSSSTSHGTTS